MTQLTECREPRSRLIAALCGWQLICVSLSYAVVGDAPLFPAAVAVLALAATLVPKSAAITTRYLAYSITAAGILTVILNSAYPVDGERFFVPVSTEIAFPVLITVACSFLFLEQRPSIISGILAIGLTLFMLQGATVNDPADHVRLSIGNAAFWQDRFFLFACILSLQLPAILILPYLVRRGTPTNPPRQTWFRLAAWLGSICVLILFTVSASWIMGRYFQVFDDFTRNLISQRPRMSQKMSFGATVNLRHTLDLKAGANNLTPQLLIHAQQPPGYLRGRAYTLYEDGRWTGTNDNQSIPSSTPPGITSKTYQLSPAMTTSSIIVDIYPTSRFSSSTLFIPGNAESIEVIADNLTLQKGGTITSRGLKKSAGWRIRSSKANQAASWPAPTPPDDVALLYVPPLLAEELNAIAAEALTGAPDAPNRRILHLAQWVSNRCDYSLEADQPSNMDPALGFLNESRAGHCELFATATAMLLRQSGIPARYVMGYMAMAPAGREGWYVARSADCHAWVEAWNGSEWMLIEPTPASGVPQSEDPDWIQAFKLAVTSTFRDVMAGLERGYFSAAIGSLLMSAVGFVVWLFWAGPWPIGWLLLVIIAGASIVLVRRKRATKEIDSPRAALASILSPLLRDLAQHGIHRTAATSVRQLTQKVTMAGIPKSSQIVALLNDYESLRYGPEAPTPESIHALTQQLNRLRSKDSPSP